MPSRRIQDFEKISVLEVLDEEHFSDVWSILEAELPEALAVQLGPAFLKQAFLPDLLHSTEGFGFIAKGQSGETIGFILGGATGGFFGAIRTHPLTCARLLMKALVANPSLLFTLIKVALLSGLEFLSGHRANSSELLYMAVTKKHQEVGVGRELLKALLKELKVRKKSLCYVQTVVTNMTARKFYARHGFIQYSEPLGRAKFVRLLSE